MYYINCSSSFDSAHFLSNYSGKCENIHGHRWNVDVLIKAETLSEEKQTKGMVIDFSEIKDVLNKLLKEFDHSFIVEKGSMRKETLKCLLDEGFKITLVDFRTTAENFAIHIFNALKSKGYNVGQVKVFETPNNCAIYEE